VSEQRDQPCTALDSRDDRADLLVTPPCDCPRCAPDRFYQKQDDDGWLRMSGTRQRYRVEPFPLGAAGREVLG
jgi:hypothetical protein